MHLHLWAVRLGRDTSWPEHANPIQLVSAQCMGTVVGFQPVAAKAAGLQPCACMHGILAFNAAAAVRPGPDAAYQDFYSEEMTSKRVPETVPF